MQTDLHAIRQDSTLSFSSLVSHLGIKGSITITPLIPHSSVISSAAGSLHLPDADGYTCIDMYRYVSSLSSIPSGSIPSASIPSSPTASIQGGDIYHHSIHPDPSGSIPSSCTSDLSVIPSGLTSLIPSGTSVPLPIRIDIDLSFDREERTQTESVEILRSDSTIHAEVVQDTNKQSKVSAWWLKMRYRAILCILLLLLPFIVVGFYRLRSIRKP